MVLSRMPVVLSWPDQSGRRSATPITCRPVGQSLFIQSMAVDFAQQWVRTGLYERRTADLMRMGAISCPSGQTAGRAVLNSVHHWMLQDISN
jgi:hypothetical protein